ncbi:MAG: peptidase M4 [Vicinamibacterales bacterium]
MPAKARVPPPVAYEISDRVPRQALVRPYQRDARAPLVRPLRIYTLDPSVSDRIGGVATVNVPYEKLERGPIGSLFRIVSDGAPDPLVASALDLDDPTLLMSSGLSPSPANGLFHLQMVYAVCSLTYAAFRKALGREIAWATTPVDDGPLRLVVRPFGFEGSNAGYSREAGDLSFGYFSAGDHAAGFTLRGGLIATALSHDIVAHETTHALLDGLRSSFMDPSNVDVPAFHEAFSDLVALFLHFTYADVVERGIRESRGGFARGMLLTDLAREFGYARSKTGRAEALRSGVDLEGVAALDSDALPQPDGTPGAISPVIYDPKLEPHTLGSVLVSAVFEAFATVVKRKTERYYRIAGLDPQNLAGAALNDALIKAVAQEASDVAGQFLSICIRAIDYCPPTDMELGEYLRAIITADGDLERSDKWGFREALMRSFRRREIFPQHVRFMTEDAVRWQPLDGALRIPDLAFRRLKFDGDPGQPADVKELLRQAHALGRFVTDPRHAGAFHVIPPGAPLPNGITQASPPSVQSVRVARRAAPDGRVVFDLIAEVTQSCTVARDGTVFDMNGGCTLVIDPQGAIRYAIYKRFDGATRSERQHAAITGPLARFWSRKGRHYQLRPEMLRRLHGLRETAATGAHATTRRRKT